MREQRQWLFEAPYPSQIAEAEGNIPEPIHQRKWLFEVLPKSISSEADYMAGKQRKGKEHTKTTGGSKTRTRNRHQEGQARQGSQNQRADQRNEATRQEVERKRRERATALTGKANPSRAEVEKIWKDKRKEQEDVRAALDLARQRRQPELVQELKEKFDQLEKQIKDLGQLRLEV